MATLNLPAAATPRWEPVLHVDEGVVDGIPTGRVVRLPPMDAEADAWAVCRGVLKTCCDVVAVSVEQEGVAS